VSERGQQLEAYLRDGVYEVAWTCGRPAGDTVVMLRARAPHENRHCPSIWLSLRDPQDVALLCRLRDGEDQKAPAVAQSEAALAPLVRRLSPLMFVRGLFM
jgi:hypothetical protein